MPLSNGDEHKRLLVRVAIPQTDGVFQPFIHYDCIHNQLRAIHNRVIGKVERPSRGGLALLQLAVRDLTANLRPSGEDDLYALARRHGGQKGRRYADAARAFETFGPFRSDSFVKMFVKAERLDPGLKVDPDPRAIQFRGAKYCVELATFLRPIEEQLYCCKTASDGVPRSRNVAKGLNSVERAELLSAKMRAFDRPVLCGLDASRFDKHVDVELLKLEHRVYKSANGSTRFSELLTMQLMNRCFSSLGILYKTRGRRMSGDMNTAIGNVIIMLLMIIAYCRYVLALRRWDCLDDGDDILVILEEEDYVRFRSELLATFGLFGMEMKVDEPCRSIHEVVFCQSKVVEYDFGRFKFVRDYRSVMSKAACGVRNWHNPVFRQRVLHAIGTCELVLGLGVPVLQAYALALLRNTRGSKDPLHHAPDGLRARALRDARLLGIRDLSHVRPSPIKWCARNSFAIAFGLSELQQLAIEKWLDSWSFDISTLVNFGEELEVITWSGAQSMSELYRVKA